MPFVVDDQDVGLQALDQVVDVPALGRVVPHHPRPAVDDQQRDLAVVGHQLRQLRRQVLHLLGAEVAVDRVSRCPRSNSRRPASALRRDSRRRTAERRRPCRWAPAWPPTCVYQVVWPTLKLLALLGHSANPSWWRVVSTPNFAPAALAAWAHWRGFSVVPGLKSLMGRFPSAHAPVYVRIPKWWNMPNCIARNERLRSSRCAVTSWPLPPPVAAGEPACPPVPAGALGQSAAAGGAAARRRAVRACRCAPPVPHRATR